MTTQIKLTPAQRTERIIFIQRMLLDGKNMTGIGEMLRITRERVRQLAKKIPWPEGYLRIKDYAALNGLKPNTILQQTISGVLPAIRYGDFILIAKGAHRRCVCGNEIVEKCKHTCPSCRIKQRRKEVKALMQYHKLHYQLAKSLGFTCREAAVLQNWSEKRIRKLAAERAAKGDIGLASGGTSEIATCGGRRPGVHVSRLASPK